MNSNLISKNISGYFDDLINKPIITQPQKQSSMSFFYKNYVEHNLLLIIIIIFIILFLLFKYFSKNINNDDENDTNMKEKEKEKEIEKEIEKNNKKKEKELIQKIRRERELLEKEKSEILSIIDELSEMNYNRVAHQDIKKESLPSLKKENERINNKNKINYENNFEAYTNNENYSDDYYDIKENKSELIDGVYFETPYN